MCSFFLKALSFLMIFVGKTVAKTSAVFYQIKTLWLFPRELVMGNNGMFSERMITRPSIIHNKSENSKSAVYFLAFNLQILISI